MYYKFRAEIELKEKFETPLVNRSIRKVLKEFKTDNFETNDNIVSFKNSNYSGKCRSTVSYMTIVDKGNFEVEYRDGKTRINYISYSSIWGYIFMFLFICVAGLLSKSVGFFLAGCVFLGFGILLTYLTIKNGTLAILSKVKENLENQKRDE
ncbi:MAG: hypothetical protein EHM93_07300 [Bacteroidales bacterium]|nr:MAG: hypothetical protein EHM93_07300 [Bacteroidales bacterium]